LITLLTLSAFVLLVSGCGTRSNQAQQPLQSQQQGIDDDDELFDVDIHKKKVKAKVKTTTPKSSTKSSTNKRNN